LFAEIERALAIAKANHDERFSIEEKVLFAIDQVVTQAEIRRLYECVLATSLAKDKLEQFSGEMNFLPYVSQMYANNYSFGTVGTSENASGKITIKVDPDGMAALDDIFVFKTTITENSWWRFAGNGFQRDDAYCLSCHQKQEAKQYLFGQSFYRRVRD
jgi:hypothetical protein